MILPDTPAVLGHNVRQAEEVFETDYHLFELRPKGRARQNRMRDSDKAGRHDDDQNETVRLTDGLKQQAMLLEAQDNYREAESLYARALAIDEKTLGPDHPYVLQILRNYSALLHKMGRPDEAAKMEARAAVIPKS